ncbi:MAG: glycosyltransferase [Acidobacteria bacterium]|nr:glycosyltransferase [Acidobacteriota bacterium]
MREAARHVTLFLAPSQTIADWFLRFGIDRTRLRRCRQGIDVRGFSRITRQPSRVLRIGYAGGLLPSKAPDVLLRAVARLPRGSASVDILGSTSARPEDDAYARALSPLLGEPFMRRLGPVPHDRMPAALSAIDVLVVPSVWIENAPFIIHEAFAAQIPIVASNLGGMAEMVRDGVDGLLFDAGDDKALSVQLRRLIDETGLLERLRAAIQPPLTIEEDAAALRLIYADLLRQPRVPPAQRSLQATRSDTAVSVTAVVLNYRTPEQTWLAARSVKSSLAARTRLIVVDNGSDDGSATALRSSLPTADVIETGANLGYSGGCNVGIRRALDDGASFVLLVNSDAVLAPDAVDMLLAAANRDPSAGILAPVLLSREEPDRIASAGIAFSGRTGRMRHRAAGHPLALLEPVAALTVDAVSACVMLVRREVFDSVGWLDEEYFFSFEDIDFCLRAAEAGFRTVCVPEAVAYHEGGRTIGRRSPRRVYFATRNHLRLARRLAPRRSASVVARAALIVGLNAAYVLRAPEVPLVSGMVAVARGAWHHLCGRYGSD